MPVSDFECQIVRGQIGRYLDGGVLSPQALAGLEGHLAECPNCKAAVTERRATILGTLGTSNSDAPTRAVVSMPVENSLVAALRARAEEEMTAPTSGAESVAKNKPSVKAAPRYAKGTSAKKPLTKPLALTALLALVLLVMGRLSPMVTAPTSKASASFAAEALPDSTPEARPSLPSAPGKAKVEGRVMRPASVPTVPKPKVVPKTIATKAGGGSLSDLFESTPKPKAASNPGARDTVPASKKPLAKPPKAIVTKPRLVPSRPRPVLRRVRTIARRMKKGLRHVKPAIRVPRTTVRVYGLDGHPLKP